MTRTPPAPQDRARPFQLEELFFSTTDRKGIITSGNEVFVGVSGYPIDQLIGAPHNIIRHPDMPRVVFALLWEYIRAGKPIVAYVKNMAADGSYYWVLAVVTPIAEGFLSIRLKPSSDFLEPVAALYAQLRQTEADVEAAGEGNKAAMDKSRGQLMAAMSSLGFENYDQFMHQVLVAEVSSRKRLVSGGRAGGRGATGASGVRASGCATLTAEVGSLFEGLGALLELDKALAQEAAFIRTLSRELHVLLAQRADPRRQPWQRRADAAGRRRADERQRPCHLGVGRRYLCLP